MSFNVSADAYGRFMGRFSEPLAVEFAEWSGVADGQQALDVGCGPGALTARLVELLGADQVRAVDPSPSFVAAARARFPGLDIAEASAESLPLPDAAVDLAMAQLVVHFMTDPVAGLREMARVTRPGGTVAACVWDLGPGARAPISLLWRAVHDLDPGFVGEAELPGGGRGELAELAAAAGLADIRDGELTVTSAFADFDDWWEPYTLGVGPAGAYVAGLDQQGRDQLRARCRELLPAGPFEISATAWCVRGRA
ncbi:class I SAM-dependent methyltransferase [Nakamurella lactea]|uniref:class I SAM-dependent methyltransferase n=1 Tax=Nakamurella lactea TaxID=459515 RepID=UPI00040AC448|nr:class I SAM-dependent methyltransferase [Nakamurella lactea]